MQRFLSILAFGFLTLATALPAVAAGVAGTVVDAHTGRPLAGVPVTIRSWESHPRVWRERTARDGSFANITLPPGRYLVVARVPGRTLGCAVDDAFSGEVAHVRIGVGGAAIMCSGPRVQPAIVDPNETADVYRVR